MKDFKIINCLALHAHDLVKRQTRARIKQIKNDYEIHEWNDGIFLFKDHEFQAYRGKESKDWLRDGIKEVKRIGLAKGLEYIWTESDEHMAKFLIKNGFYKVNGAYQCVLKK